MKIKLLALFITASFFLKAQTYSISPSKVVTFTAALNTITTSDIYQTNTGSSTITLLWKSISNAGPVSWSYSMCDLGTCYPGLPAGPSAMNTINVGAQGFLGLNVDPGNTPGTATVVSYVYQQGFPDNGDTLVWKITTPPVGIEEIFANGAIKVFPNPVTDNLNIELDRVETSVIHLNDATGRTVFTASVEAGNNNLDLSSISKGFYILRIEQGDKTMVKRITKQ